MAVGGRDFQIPGETLVQVKFAEHVSGIQVRELGLTTDAVRIMPNFRHKEITVDDFPEIPVEMQWELASVDIRMNLIHYNYDTLNICVDEAMCGSSDGTLAAAGLLLGRGKRIFESGNHYVSLNLIPNPLAQVRPFRFRASFIQTPPFEMPYGTTTSIVAVNWRAIPYVPPLLPGTQVELGENDEPNQEVPVNNELISSGSILWDRTPDVL